MLHFNTGWDRNFECMLGVSSRKTRSKIETASGALGKFCKNCGLSELLWTYSLELCQEERSKTAKSAPQAAAADLVIDDELEAMRQEALAEEAATNENTAPPKPEVTRILLSSLSASDVCISGPLATAAL